MRQIGEKPAGWVRRDNSVKNKSSWIRRQFGEKTVDRIRRQFGKKPPVGLGDNSVKHEKNDLFTSSRGWWRGESRAPFRTPPTQAVYCEQCRRRWRGLGTQPTRAVLQRERFHGGEEGKDAVERGVREGALVVRLYNRNRGETLFFIVVCTVFIFFCLSCLFLFFSVHCFYFSCRFLLAARKKNNGSFFQTTRALAQLQGCKVWTAEEHQPKLSILWLQGACQHAKRV